MDDNKMNRWAIQAGNAGQAGNEQRRVATEKTQVEKEQKQVEKMGEIEREILQISETIHEANGLLKIVQLVSASLNGATVRQRVLVRQAVEMAFDLIDPPPMPAHTSVAGKP